MRSELLDVRANLHRADDLLRSAHDSGVELAVLPELFNTGYSLCPDYGPYSETAAGPTLLHLRQRSRPLRTAIPAGLCPPGARPAQRSRSLLLPPRPAPPS